MENSNLKSDDTINLISKVRTSANQLLMKEMEAMGMHGLVPSHGEILLALLTHKELMMKEIAEKINRDPSTVTTLVNKLKKSGYVKTKKSSENGRTTLVYLTEEGEALKDRFIQISETLNQTYQKEIEEKDLVIFRKVLEKIYHNFKKSPSEK